MAGFERGVRPMGDWSISITLSIRSIPSMARCFPGRSRAPQIRAASAGYRICVTRLDLPEPLTPVTATKRPSGKATSIVAQVVLRAPAHRQPLAAPLATPARHGHEAVAAQVGGGDRALVLQQLVQRSGVDQLTAVLSGARADVDHPVGGADRLLVVLDHDQRVAEVAQPHQRGDQPGVVALVQPDRRLVEDVEDAHQARADLGRQSDALRLAAGERSRGAVQGQVVEPNIHQEVQPRADLLEHLPRDVVLALGQALGRAPYQSSASVTDRRVVSMMFRVPTVTDSDSALQPHPAAGGARLVRHVAARSPP